MITRDWRISTVRKGWSGGRWDLGQKPFTRAEAEAEAARLNEAHQEYQHEVVHVTWPVKKGKP